jgi:tetratricopeptide (TPR) repeat protein
MRQTVSAAPRRWVDVATVSVAVAVCAAVYANTVTGEFVYDDADQLLQNQLIQDNRHLWRALTSDVWAFKASTDGPVSHLWRPLFTLWLIVNHRLFGLGGTTGWHVSNIALHASVVVTAYGLLRCLLVAPLLSAVIVLIFAVHPLQVESVAWISGSPNMLSAATMLGALWCLLSARRRPRLKWGMALVFYALSLLAKETGMLFPAIVFVAACVPARRPVPLRRRAVRAAVVAAPFAMMTALFFVVRFLVLGEAELQALWRQGPGTVIATLPSIFTFYLRQIAFPYWLGLAHPLPVMAPAEIGFSNFVAPLVIGGAALLALAWAAGREPVRRIGLALFVTALAPVMNCDAFVPERIVQDRYLYLPLLGVLMVVVPAGMSALRARFEGHAARARVAMVLGGFAVCVPLTIQTVRYNRAWRSELSLWEWGVKTFPDSAFNQEHYGSALLRAGRLEEARRAYDRSIAIAPSPAAVIDRAAIAIHDGRFAEAEADLRSVIQAQPFDLVAYEQLGLCYQRQGRLDEAAAVLRAAREQVPLQTGKITANLAAILYEAGRKDEALAELESVANGVDREYGPASWRALYLLGVLRVEMGQRDEARSALAKYVQLTSGAQDARSVQLRAQAQQALRRLEPLRTAEVGADGR